MVQVLSAYSRYELLFTPHLIPTLKDLRGEEWQRLVRSLRGLPETHPDVLAFSMMMIELNRCLGCDMDCYRAQKGCVLCARQNVVSFKGSDRQLVEMFEKARKRIYFKNGHKSYQFMPLQVAA